MIKARRYGSVRAREARSRRPALQRLGIAVRGQPFPFWGFVGRIDPLPCRERPRRPLARVELRAYAKRYNPEFTRWLRPLRFDDADYPIYHCRRLGGAVLEIQVNFEQFYEQLRREIVRKLLNLNGSAENSAHALADLTDQLLLAITRPAVLPTIR